MTKSLTRERKQQGGRESKGRGVRYQHQDHDEGEDEDEDDHAKGREVSRLS